MPLQDPEADRLYGQPSGREAAAASEDPEDESDINDIFAEISDDEASAEETGAHSTEEGGEAEHAQVVRAVQDAWGGAQQNQGRRPELLDEAVPESEYNLSLGMQPELCMHPACKNLPGLSQQKLYRSQTKLRGPSRQEQRDPAIPPCTTASLGNLLMWSCCMLEIVRGGCISCM